jgi:REP element-mobilizing transposase RayT
MYAWCVMPNHMHALFRVFDGHALPEILHGWKSFSAPRATKVLERSGGFWQREYDDHLVRSEDEFYRVVNYIAENPNRAGLCSWRWVGVDLKQKKRAGILPALKGNGRNFVYVSEAGLL